MTVTLSVAVQRWLLASARHALAVALAERGMPPPRTPADPGPPPPDAALREAARLFVSWHRGPELQGCIGTLSPWPSLADGVRHYAVLAGLEDRRTPPLDPGDLAGLRLDISILSPPTPLPAVGLRAIAQSLVPHRDGVILSCGDRSAFFLPVVWSSLPDPPQFLAHLCRKAGLDAERDGAQCRAETLEAFSFSDPAVD